MKSVTLRITCVQRLPDRQAEHVSEATGPDPYLSALTTSPTPENGEHQRAMQFLPVLTTACGCQTKTDKEHHNLAPTPLHRPHRHKRSHPQNQRGWGGASILLSHLFGIVCHGRERLLAIHHRRGRKQLNTALDLRLDGRFVLRQRTFVPLLKEPLLPLCLYLRHLTDI